MWHLYVLQLCNAFITTTTSVAGTVGEEIVEDESENWEEEDDEEPKDLVGDWAAGLEDLNCGEC